MTYETTMKNLDENETVHSAIINRIKNGDRYGIFQLFENDNTRFYCCKTDRVIRIIDGQVQIQGTEKQIKKTKSKLLKIVRGLELN